MEPDTDDVIGDVAWMTYGELGRARGISALSAKRLAQRRRWRRQQGNDGTSRVAVPVTEAAPHETKHGDVIGDVASDIARVVIGFEAALATLREQLQGAERRAQAAEKGREAVESEARDLRERLEQAEAAAEQARRKAVHEAREAAQALDALRAVEAARLAHGLLARLRAAWRGR